MRCLVAVALLGACTFTQEVEVSLGDLADGNLEVSTDSNALAVDIKLGFAVSECPKLDAAVTVIKAARPDVVLLNGGLFASPVLRARLLEVVASWFSSAKDSWSPLVLDNPRLDLAVAQGAAYYGMVRRGKGVSISANLARSYYIGVAGERPCAVIPARRRASIARIC